MKNLGSQHPISVHRIRLAAKKLTLTLALKSAKNHADVTKLKIFGGMVHPPAAGPVRRVGRKLHKSNVEKHCKFTIHIALILISMSVSCLRMQPGSSERQHRICVNRWINMQKSSCYQVSMLLLFS